MYNKLPFYILWGEYYNPILDISTEKMLGCFKEASNANRMADSLQKMKPAWKYFVSTEFFCDEEEN